MKIDTATVAAMASAGIGFVGNLRAPGGGASVWLEPGDVPRFVADRYRFAAEEAGVSKETYLEWIETDGTPRCGAITQKGARCQLSVSGGCQRSLEEWIRLNGQYCSIHGGERSDRS